MIFNKLVVIIMTIFNFYGECQHLVNEGDDQDEIARTISVDAVLAHSTSLPCDIQPPDKDDRVYMVLWYKDGDSKPIYTYDVRGRSFDSAMRWSDPNTFGPRAYFVTISQNATLTLDGVTLEDAGIYRCRVDFKTTPTRNFAINLTVIVPPHQLLLYDKMGRDVNDIVGPLEEGSDLILTCEVRGGSPSPTVSWFRSISNNINDRSSLIEGNLETITRTNVIVNRLEVKNLTRNQLNSTFKCQASNTKLTMPVEKLVKLEMLLRPLSVIIPIKPRELIADEEITLQCEVYGSRPKARIEWKRDIFPFKRGKIYEDNSNDSVSISSLTFSPSPEDDNAVIKCIAENTMIRDSAKEDYFKLNVVYPPKVQLRLGTNFNPNDIKEGIDVYFECDISANPKVHKITWFRNGILLNQNQSVGIIMTAHSLVLQSITRKQSGNYTCLTANPRGETMSPSVALKVRYAPVCKESEITVIGASLDELITVRCKVAADPNQNVTFVWQFNNSGESFDAQQMPNKFTTTTSSSSSNLSELSYSAKSQKDYGTLTCWGTNEIGRQIDPCIFQVVPASKPAPLTNCTLKTVANDSVEMVDVECRAGYDGGLPQKFILEAFDADSLIPRLNKTVYDTDLPIFHLDLNDLLPASASASLRLVIYAVNAKGLSERLILDDITLNDAEKRTDGGHDGTASSSSSSSSSLMNLNLVPLAGLLTGSLLTLGIAILVIVVIAIRRKRHPHYHHHHHCDHHSSHHISLDASAKNNPATTTTTKSCHGSMLEINTGDNRYVVAYTLKPAEECSNFENLNDSTRRPPDILNTPRGGGGGGGGGESTTRITAETEFSSSSSASSSIRPGELFPSSATNNIINNNGEINKLCRNLIVDNNSSSKSYPNLQSQSNNNCDISGTLGRTRTRPRDLSYGSFATIRRDQHIITDTIPGPESCV